MASSNVNEVSLNYVQANLWIDQSSTEKYSYFLQMDIQD
jgi:hypothetical protein